MAIAHLSVTHVSRGSNGTGTGGICSAVAAAAYLARERLRDEQGGRSYDYTQRGDAQAWVQAPEDAPDWVYDRERLWNTVQAIETRKNARFANKLDIALPRELDGEQQWELVWGYVQTAFVARGMVADVAIHADHPDNPHAHVLLSTRAIRAEGFGGKVRGWQDRQLVEAWRQDWQEEANRALEQARVPERIDMRSYARQGVERTPTVHEGPSVRELERRGIVTELGEHNRAVERYNDVREELARTQERARDLARELAQERWIEQRVPAWEQSGATTATARVLAGREEARGHRFRSDAEGLTAVEQRWGDLERERQALGQARQELEQVAWNYARAEELRQQRTAYDGVGVAKRLLEREAYQALRREQEAVRGELGRPGTPAREVLPGVQTGLARREAELGARWADERPGLERAREELGGRLAERRRVPERERLPSVGVAWPGRAPLLAVDAERWVGERAAAWRQAGVHDEALGRAVARIELEQGRTFPDRRAAEQQVVARLGDRERAPLREITGEHWAALRARSWERTLGDRGLAQVTAGLERERGRLFPEVTAAQGAVLARLQAREPGQRAAVPAAAWQQSRAAEWVRQGVAPELGRAFARLEEEQGRVCSGRPEAEQRLLARVRDGTQAPLPGLPVAAWREQRAGTWQRQGYSEAAAATISQEEERLGRVFAARAAVREHLDGRVGWYTQEQSAIGERRQELERARGVYARLERAAAADARHETAGAAVTRLVDRSARLAFAAAGEEYRAARQAVARPGLPTREQLVEQGRDLDQREARLAGLRQRDLPAVERARGETLAQQRALERGRERGHDRGRDGGFGRERAHEHTRDDDDRGR